MSWPHVTLHLELPDRLVDWMTIPRANVALIAKGLADPNLQNVGFLHHAMQVTTGQAGELKLVVHKLDRSIPEHETIDYSTLLSAISSIATNFVYVLENPLIDVHALQQTMLPETEIHRTGSSSSTSNSSSIESVQPLTAREARCAGLNLGDAANDEEQTMGNTAGLMREDVESRDVECRATGMSAGSSDNVHLVKKCNPGLALQHILTTRIHPEEVNSVDTHSFLEHGMYDRRVGFLLAKTLHGLLQSNEVAFYPRANRNGDRTRQIYLLPMNDDALKDLRLHAGLLGQPFDARIGEDGQPLVCFWDWLFGSRMLANFGSQEAKDLSAESPIVRAVYAWREKQQQYKSNKRAQLNR